MGISWGLSTITVFVPTSIASDCLRSNCTSERDALLLIHFDVPSVAAIFPSRVAAIFQVKYGRFFLIFISQALFECAASSLSTPSITLIPAASNLSAPPAAIALGSFTANTTVDIPASIIASVQAAVAPT